MYPLTWVQYLLYNVRSILLMNISNKRAASMALALGNTCTYSAVRHYVRKLVGMARVISGLARIIKTKTWFA